MSILLVVSSTAWGDIKTVTLSFSALSPTVSSKTNLIATPQDGDGIDWSFRADKVTYYRKYSEYIQIGSEADPANSITFTTTFLKDREITSLKAKIGGFSGTEGNVTLKVGSTIVASGSLNGSNDYVFSSSSTVRGTTLTVTVTNIKKGVAFYYIEYKYVTPVSEEVTVTDAKYATYCSENKLNFAGTGVAAYMAKSNGSGVELTEITDGIVPGGAGVVLYSETAGNYTIPTTTATATFYNANTAMNELLGITERSLISAAGEDGKTNYILSNEASGIGFYRAAEGGAYLRANRAYLSTSASASGVAAFLFFCDEEDGINQIEDGKFLNESSGKAERNIENAIYDLSGRRISASSVSSEHSVLPKGVYIVNGKKYIKK